MISTQRRLRSVMIASDSVVSVAVVSEPGPGSWVSGPRHLRIFKTGESYLVYLSVPFVDVSA